MENFSSNQIRKLFIDFFTAHNHHHSLSSSIIPHHDNSLLFTNAGMVQFKKCFLGLEKPPSQNIVSIQKCLRAGGKHNDLDNVGHTKRHHTFFEMMGNFSFGGYFKKEAIHMAWEFLTKILQINAEKLYVTHFHTDLETRNLWLNILPTTRIISINNNDNFWSMGDTGPQGPCTEIFYDYGPEVAGGPPGSAEQDGDRFVEIWNIVFMEEEKMTNGEIKPLKIKCIDTGIGLERLVSVLNNHQDNYLCQDFQELMKFSAQLLKTKDYNNTTHRVIADHIRSITFLINDGVLPGNEGRSYVLRRIIRRAMTYAYLINNDLQAFLYKIVDLVVNHMQITYPDLLNNQSRIKKIIYEEEEMFLRTLERGIKFLQQSIKEHQAFKVFDGNKVFKLYDTFGFPLDLTEKILKMHDMTLDKKTFIEAMNQQKMQSKNNNFVFDAASEINLEGLADTIFLGYEKNNCSAKIIQIFKQNPENNQDLIIITDHTVCYAESGGQVADHGYIYNLNNELIGEIIDVQKNNKIFMHFVKCHKELTINEEILIQIDQDRRQKISVNHTATHLLHQSLYEVLGNHITQRGSLVEENYLRFDFNHNKSLNAEELDLIEQKINNLIQNNIVIQVIHKDYQQSLREGYKAFFADKYEQEVRTVNIVNDNFHSQELCGGTHLKSTGEIGILLIISEKSIASGIRRIECMTGNQAIQYIQNARNQYSQISCTIKKPQEEILNFIKNLQEENKILKQKLLNNEIEHKISKIQYTTNQQDNMFIAKIGLLIVDELDNRTLMELMKKIQNEHSNSLFLLINKKDNQEYGMIGFTNDYKNNMIEKINIIITLIKDNIDFQGGGKKLNYQGKIKNIDNIKVLIAKILDIK